MKVSPGFRVLGLLALGLAATSPKVEAQNLDFSAGATGNPVFTNSVFTYTVTVTNFGILPANGVVVSNVLSPSLQIVSFTPDATSGTLSNANVIYFQIGFLDAHRSSQVSITVIPTLVGFVTNTVTVFETNNTADVAGPRDLIVTVTNNVPTFADLAVALTPPTQAVITNDFITYGISATNFGPSDAPDVMLTNSLVGMKFLTNVPGNLSRTLTTSNVVFKLGTLTNGAVTNISVRVQATNAGPLTLFASIGSASIQDTNTANNIASNNITVGTYLSTNLVITLVSTQSFDSLNGLMEQAVVVSNAGPSVVDSTRLVVSNQLFNAIGTNGDNRHPFVVHGAPLAPNETVSLLLQYFVPTHKPIPVSFQAFGIPAYDLTPPAQLGTEVGKRMLPMLPPGTSFPGCAAIVFPSISNQTFTVIYSDDSAFASNVFMAQPTVKAFANQTLWVDYGPPETISHPTNTTLRFFKVFLNQ